ncbi:hypothetical protein MIR68_007903 [Amoeboaphelidium protococcarum]|nr:hypothetical protein MIR68_007903 [Amoeboaphelidium protococcarum]KAI3642888.1 hypothetical protein MP228_012443 [Amoeboaphelidium protococcarum]
MDLRLVTYNVSAWNVSEQHSISLSHKLSKIVDILAGSGADVICLQEATSVLIQLILNRTDYQLVGQVTSYCEQCVLLVNRLIKSSLKEVREMDCAVVADFKYPFAIDLTDDEANSSQGETQLIRIAAVHFAPFKEGGQERLVQMANILKLPLSDANGNGQLKVKHLIVAGDANVRADEVKTMLRLSKSQNQELHDIVDDLDTTSGGLKPFYTWNSFKNRYHGNGAFQFQCRFDRVLLSSELAALEHKLVGDKYYQGGYLSDHFGMDVVIRIPPP